MRNQILKRHTYLEWNLVDDLAVVVDEHEGKVFQFNRVGTEIWKSLDGFSSAEKVVEQVISLFDAPEKKIRKEAEKFINHLYQMDLIEEVEST